jgi:CheY-like chemotaxis protein
MRTPIKPSRILVAEDDDAFRLLLLEALRDAGHFPVELEDGYELEDYLELTRTQGVTLPDLILTDLRMPGASGLEVVRRARQNGLRCPIVLLTAFPAPEVFEEADRIGHITVLGKPIEFERITECVSDLVSRAA